LDLDKEQLDKSKQKVQGKNTMKTTVWQGVRKFKNWCKKRKITADLNRVTVFTRV